MSDETKKRESAEAKAERRRRELEELMQSMERTAPKADTDLLKSLQAVELHETSPAEAASPDRAELSAPANLVPDPIGVQSKSLPPENPPRAPSAGAAKERKGEGELSPGPASRAGKRDWGEPAGDDMLILQKPEPSSAEAAIAEIARAARAFAFPETLGRGSVRVSEDVFSRITMVFAKQRIDKILVLSYLLYSYVPAENSQRIPKWLLETPPKAVRPRILVFIKDESLAKRLSDTAVRFGITEADIIENIVRRYLPEAPFQYKPKRRMRFTA
jgi:hypothetical protein